MKIENYFETKRNILCSGGSHWGACFHEELFCRSRTSRSRILRPKTVRRTDTSMYGHFAVRTFHREDTSPWGHSTVRTLRRKDASPWDFLPYEHFAANYVKLLIIGKQIDKAQGYETSVGFPKKIQTRKFFFSTLNFCECLHFRTALQVFPKVVSRNKNS